MAAVALLAGGALAVATQFRTAADAASSALAANPFVRVDGKPVTAGKPVDPAASYASTRVDVLVDGWSARTLAGLHLRWAPAGSQTFKPVELEPVTKADVAELLRTTPGALASVLARQVTGDSTLKCQADGCATKAGSIDLGLVEHPDKVPGYGVSYKGWGVESLLYRFSVTPPAGTGGVVLRADGFVDETLPTVPSELDTTPDAVNGYLRNRFVVGAGLGAFFALDPAWLDGKQIPTRWSPKLPAGIDDAAVQALKGDLPTVAAVNGLAATWKPAATATNSHLTYLTSPVSGCGVGVLCAPTKVNPTIVSRSGDSAVACEIGGKYQLPNLAVFDAVHVSTKLAAPLHQFGLYGGADASSFKGHTGFGLNGGGQPPLVSGNVDLTWSVVGMYDTADGAFRTMSGRVDAGAPRPAVTLADAMANVKFDGASWGACS